MNSMTSVFAVLVLFVVTTVVFGGGDRVYVNAAASGGNDGTSWQNAYTDLESAIQSASIGSEVWVARGSYYPTHSITSFPRPTFRLRTGVAIFGGFAGNENQLGQRDPTANQTILSGDLGRNDPASLADNTNPVVFDNGSDETAILDGFTVRGGGGRVQATQPFADGGGFGLTNSRAQIVNCIIVGNTFESSSNDPAGPYIGPSGGGAAIFGGSPTFIRCTFSGNRAGRGISGPCQGGSPRPGDMSGGRGGAAYVSSGASPSFIACMFVGNIAGNGADGIVCTFGSGGGGNGGSGGAVYSNASSPEFVNCTFARNAAGLGGAGTAGLSPRPPGSPGTGGGVRLDGGTGSIIGCTFADNFGASGVVMDVGAVRSSILNDVGAPTLGGSATVSYSLVNPPRSGLGNISGSPSFVDAAAGDYRLRRTSPCLDAGDSSAFPNNITTDVLGRPRFVDIASAPDTGAGPAPIADMGAYESPGAGPCPGDFNGNGIVSVQDVFDFLTAYFSRDPRADFNSSSVIDAQDIYDFLDAYFAACE